MEETQKKYITRTHLVQSIQGLRKELTHLLDRLDKVEELVNIVYDNEEPHKQTFLGVPMESYSEKTTIQKETFCTRPSRQIQYASKADHLKVNQR